MKVREVQNYSEVYRIDIKPEGFWFYINLEKGEIGIVNPNIDKTYRYCYLYQVFKLFNIETINHFLLQIYYFIERNGKIINVEHFIKNQIDVYKCYDGSDYTDYNAIIISPNYFASHLLYYCDDKKIIYDVQKSTCAFTINNDRIDSKTTDSEIKKIAEKARLEYHKIFVICGMVSTMKELRDFYITKEKNK